MRDHVNLRNAALSEFAGQAHLLVREATALGGLSRIIGANTSETVPIGVVLIDQVIPDTAAITILHLDVEQHEAQAIVGARNTIARCQPRLILETVPQPETAAGQLLRSFNYRAVGKLSSNTLLAPYP